jgi:yecA family protein
MSEARLSADLTEAELDRLGQFLRQFPRAMNLETMDGFFSALICAPERVPMGEVMSRVWGEAAEFASDHEVREIMALLLRHWNAISSALNGDDVQARSFPKSTIKNEFLFTFQTHMSYFTSPNW